MSAPKTPRTLERYIESPGTRKKRRRIIFISIIVIFILGFGLFTLWFLTRSDFFAVRAIHVTGAAPLTDHEVIQDADAVVAKGSWGRLLGSRNILVWPSVLTSGDFTLTPQIAGLTVSKDYWQGTLDIAVETRKPIGIWCSAGDRQAPVDTVDATSTVVASFSCFTFDQGGFIYDNAPHAEGGLLHVVDDYTKRPMGIGSYILPQRFVAPLLSIFRVLTQSETSVKEMRLDNLALEEVGVATYGGPVLKFSLRFDGSYALPVLLSLESKPGFSSLQYVDFRTQGRAYYR